MRDKITAVAAALGGRVRFLHDRGQHYAQDEATITLPDGVQMFLRPGGYGNEGRIHASGSYPSYERVEHGREIVTPGDIYEGGKRLESPSITVADTKTPEQIAKDIERRLLPDLRHVWLACKAHCDSNTARQAQRKATVERVAKATGGQPNVHNESARVSYGYEIGDAEYRGGYSDDNPEHFKVTLADVSEAKLVEIMRVIRRKA